MAACATALVALLVSPLAAQAQTQYRYTLDGYAEQAYKDMRTALQYETDGQNQDACRYYRSAISELASAVFAMLNEKGSVTIAELESESNYAEARAKEVCGKPDEAPITWSSPSSSGPDVDTPPGPQLTGDLKTANDFFLLAVSQLKADQTAEGCVSLRKARNLWVKVLDEIADNPAAIPLLTENIGIAEKHLANFSCPPDKPVQAAQQKIFDETAYANVAFATAIAAKNRSDFVGACGQMKISAGHFTEAKSWNAKARTVEGHEELNPQWLDGNDAVFDEYIAKTHARAKTYCTQAGIPYEESTPAQ